MKAIARLAALSLVAAIVGLVGVIPAGARSGTTVAGGNGSGLAANQLNHPNSVVVDSSGNIYVADSLNNRVQRWAPGATSGVTVAGGNGAGSAADQLWYPFDVAFDSSGNLYVSDTFNQRIQRWAPGATSGVTVAGGNGYGSAANQFGYPNGLVVDSSGDIYVAEFDNNRVQRWAPGATSGVTVAGGNGYGSAANQFAQPVGVALDTSGHLYVADSANVRVQRWAPGATSGVTVAGGNGYGSAANQFAQPMGVELDGSGHLYVADYFNGRVQRWAPGATSGVTVASDFFFPAGVALDGNGNLYVVSVVDRVQRWSADHAILLGGASLAEGHAGTCPLQMPVSLSSPFTEAITVQWATVQLPGDRPDQADPTTDYTPASGTVTFNPGEIDATVTVTINGDTLVEPDEYIVISFHDPTNTTIDTPEARGIILNDDDHALAPGVVSAPEGTAGTAPALAVPINLPSPSTDTVTVQWTTADLAGSRPDQADPNTDYTAASGTVTFNPGETTKSVSIAVNGDTLVEPDEYIVVSFHDPTNATLGGFWGLGIGVITNDDHATATPGLGSTIEGDAGTTTLTVPVTLSNPSAQTVIVQWRTVSVPGNRPEQADPNTDYTAASGTITFNPGETAKSAAITVKGDAFVEPDEYIIVSFHDPTNATIGGFWGLGIGVITNND